MRSTGVKKISEGAYFVVDTLAFRNQVIPFDLALATQTISSVAKEDTMVTEEAIPPNPEPSVPPAETS